MDGFDSFFFLGFFAFSLAALVLAADFLDPPILPISLAVIAGFMVLSDFVASAAWSVFAVADAPVLWSVVWW